jgi:hypothetical protein
MNPNPKPPLPGGEYTFMTDTGRQSVPPGTPVVNLIPVGDGGPGPLLPRMFRRPKRKPVLPTASEVAALPHGARVAFAVRCAARVRPLVPLDACGADVVGAAAVAILRAAPDPRDLALFRRDFEVLKRRARGEEWTDETAVPPDVFGPMWPEGRVPTWARQATGPREKGHIG